MKNLIYILISLTLISQPILSFAEVYKKSFNDWILGQNVYGANTSALVSVTPNYKFLANKASFTSPQNIKANVSILKKCSFSDVNGIDLNITIFSEKTLSHSNFVTTSDAYLMLGKEKVKISLLRLNGQFDKKDKRIIGLTLLPKKYSNTTILGLAMKNNYKNLINELQTFNSKLHKRMLASNTMTLYSKLHYSQNITAELKSDFSLIGYTAASNNAQGKCY